MLPNYYELCMCGVCVCVVAMCGGYVWYVCVCMCEVSKWCMYVSAGVNMSGMCVGKSGWRPGGMFLHKLSTLTTLSCWSARPVQWRSSITSHQIYLVCIVATKQYLPSVLHTLIN